MKKQKTTTKKKPTNPNVERYMIQNPLTRYWWDCDRHWVKGIENAFLFNTLKGTMQEAAQLKTGWQIRRVIFNQDQKAVYLREVTSEKPNISSLPKNDWVIVTLKKPIEFYNADEGVWTDDIDKASSLNSRGDALRIICDDELLQSDTYIYETAKAGMVKNPKGYAARKPSWMHAHSNIGSDNEPAPEPTESVASRIAEAYSCGYRAGMAKGLLKASEAISEADKLLSGKELGEYLEKLSAK